MIYFDTFPERVDPAAECAANVAMVNRLSKLVDGINIGDVKAAQENQDAIRATRLFHDAVILK